MLKRSVLTLLGSFATLMTISLFWDEPFLATTLLILIAGSWMVTGNIKEALVFLIVGLSGSIAEIIAVSFGAWEYSYPAFLGIPIWLPFVWGICGIFVARISEKFNKIRGYQE